MKVIAAVDIGTMGTKATLVGREGMVVASAYASYASQGEGNRVEQDPGDWWEATVMGLHSLWEQAPEARPVALVLSGQMQDVILVDNARPLAPAILYSDVRAQDEAQHVLERLGEARLHEVTGNLQDASSLLAKLLWVKNNLPDVYRSAQTLFVGAHDFVAWRLCGARAADHTTASTTGLLNLRANAWAVDFLDELGLRTDWLPELYPAEAQVGEIGKAVAQETGLPVGTPVFHGAGDVATTTIGAGAGEPGRYYVYLGTSGWLAATWPGKPVDPLTGIFNLRHPALEWLIRIGPMLTAAGNFEWLRAQFGWLEAQAAGQTDEDTSYEILNVLASEAPPGSGGVLYLPYLAGERAPIRDPHARGVFFGLSRHTTRQCLYRAVLEGVAFSMRTIRDAMLPAEGANARPELSLVGGGARSALWGQVFADVFDCPVHALAAPGDVGARGAALLAGKALGWYDSYMPGAAFFPAQHSYVPDPQAVASYDRLYTVFQALYPALRSGFSALSQVLAGVP